ncbi:MAG: SDR family NAD(P)-dependent oxidoreductase [Spirochaetota bacterium]
MRVDLDDRWVLVSGATGGLGAAFCHRLYYQERAKLILTDQDEEKLLLLKKELLSRKDSSEADIVLIPSDLCNPLDRDDLCAKVSAYPLTGIINNAGLTSYQGVEPAELSRYQKIIELNFSALVHLSTYFLPVLARSSNSFLLNVSSLAGYFPLPYQVVYAATKAAVSSFTIGLRWEKQYKNILIALLVPGSIRSPMTASSGLGEKFGHMERMIRSPDTIAGYALKGLKRGKKNLVPFFSEKLAYHLFPRLSKDFVARRFEPHYRKDV